MQSAKCRIAESERTKARSVTALHRNPIHYKCRESLSDFTKRMSEGNTSMSNLLPFRPRQPKPPQADALKALRKALSGLQRSAVSRSGRGK